MDESLTDFDVSLDTAFIGRSKHINNLEDAWPKYSLFCVFGLRQVGKTRFVKEVVNRKLEEFREKKPGVQVCYWVTDLSIVTDIQTLHSRLCALIGVVPEIRVTDNIEWKKQIVSGINNLQKVVVLLFDNAEDVVEEKGDRQKGFKDDLLSLCVMLVKRCKYLKLFITSTTKVMFSQIPYLTLELPPLSPLESAELLRSVTPGVELGKYETELVALSEGIPLLILMVGSELFADDGMIEPAEMVELLTMCRLRALSREFYPEEDRITDVFHKFILRLSDVFQRRLAILGYIPGSFDAQEATEMLGQVSVALAKDQVLVPIRRRNMLTYDPSTKRFNIQVILRDCLHVYFVIKNMPEIRKRYSRTFIKVMQNICLSMGTEEYTKALSNFALEQPNLQKLLTEVWYTKEDTYPFFIKVAETCTHLIEQFMTSDSDKFYDGCLKMSEQYGKDADRATVYIAQGSMCTNAKGDFTTAEEKYQSALKVLPQSECSVQLAAAHQGIGWNLYCQGKYRHSVRHLKRSMDIYISLGKENTLQCLSLFSSLGIANTALGNFEEGAKYNFTALRRRKEIQGENHPSVGTDLNSIGVMFEKRGDIDKALDYFKQGLEIKEKNQTPVVSIVLSLNNVAGELSRLRQYDEANAMLRKAMERLHAQPTPHKGALSLIHDTQGKVSKSQGDIEYSCTLFQQAVDIRKEIMPNGTPYLESLVHLMQSKAALGKYRSAIRLSKKVLLLRDKTIKDMPEHPFILECLQCLSRVYKAVRDDDSYRETLFQTEAELVRLYNVYLCRCNENKIAFIANALKETMDNT